MLSGSRIMQRCDALALHSEQAGGLTRVFLSEQNRAANELVLGWMREAGMQARLDAAGNVLGRYEGERPGLPCLLLGSHLDTVRDAGKYDGMLGVVTALECVAALHEGKRRLAFAIEVAGFGDEEGVRFGTTFLGSRAIAGTLPGAALEVADGEGTSLGEALRRFGLDPARYREAARRREEILAYAELHIEQGPVLEAEGLAVGVVSAIAGFTRLRVTLKGRAGHAGTVPMALRRDALAGAAEAVLAVERIARAEPELVGTVGRLEPLPGAINVIPGEARFTVDLRAPRDPLREGARREIEAALRAIAQARGLELATEVLQEHAVTPCAPWIIAQMERAIAAEGMPVRRLASGAGHDGMALAALADIGMLFVRCKGGISHNPAESISEADAAAGARVLLNFMVNFSR